MSKPVAQLEAMWSRHAAEWRDPAQVCSQWRDAADVDSRLLESRASRGWWRTFCELGITLLITREYEHLAIALSCSNGRPRVSFFPLPHPSGLAVDRAANRVYLASTRNPNQVYTLKPVTGALERSDMPGGRFEGGYLSPVASQFYPGAMYFHDLAMMGPSVYANAVGHNAVVKLGREGGFERVWWPESIGDDFSRNYIQLNSIAAGKSVRDSFFTASSAAPGRFRPGHLKYPVDRQGVIFSGRTRDVVCGGLTRPHSARLKDGKVWVANSGYGELGFAERGRLEVVTRLPGWTRGLCMVGDIAFVATSRVIPRFAAYAPGLDVSESRCALHAVDCRSGKVRGSIEWPFGNQVFAIDWIGADVSSGFAFEARARQEKNELAFFYKGLTG